MRIRTKRHAMRGALFTFCAAIVSTVAPRAASAAGSSPVVVELFTAEGCTACIGANLNLNALADRKGVIALTFPVDYLDYIGWKDTLARPEFTERQRTYTGRFKVREIYAPEIVVDGRKELLGVDRDRVEALLKKEAGALGRGPKIRIGTARVEVGEAAPPEHGAQVWLVRYDPREQQVEVKAGDNKGKVVVLRNVVRDLAPLGAWTGRARSYALPKLSADDEGLDTVVLVQGADGGHILAAAKAQHAAAGTQG